jgi:hypothetical protein
MSSAPNEFDRYDTGAEVFGVDTHEQHHHYEEHHAYRASHDEIKHQSMKNAPLNVVLGMEGSSSRKASRVNLSPVKAKTRPKSAKK